MVLNVSDYQGSTVFMYIHVTGACNLCENFFGLF